MAVLLGKWSGGSVSISPTESWAAPANLFPTQDRNDSSTYVFNAASSALLLPSTGLADGYLIIGAFKYVDTSNGRHTPQARFAQILGSGNFVTGYTGGFDRDNSENTAWVRTWAFIDSPSASSSFQFQWKRDVDAPTGGTVRSEFQVIPLYYSNVGIYTSTSAALYGGTAPNQVTGFSAVTQSDTAAIEISSNVITLKGDNKRYLALGSQFFEGRGGRTQRWHGFRVDGSKDDAAKAYSYYRNTSNDESGDMFTTLIDRATTDITIDQFCYRGDGVSSGQGGADVDGSTPSVGNHATVIVELKDGAKVFKTTGSTNQNIATTGPIDIQASKVADIDFNDSDTFTRASDTGINVGTATDVLLGANISAASQAISSGNRFSGFAEFTKNGTEQTDSFAGDYLRGNQGSQDTFGWSANLLGFVDVAADDDVGISATELSGSEGGGGAVHIQSGWAGFWGIDLDTLDDEGSSGDTFSGDGTDVDTAVGAASIAQDHKFTGTGITSEAALGEAAVSQDHKFAGSGIDADTTVGTGSFGEIHRFSAGGLEQDNTIGTASISQDHKVSGQRIEVDTEIGSASVTQNHKFSGVGIEVEPTVAAGNFGGVSTVDTFAGTGLDVDTEIGQAGVGQDHKFGAAGLSIDNEVGAGTFSQETNFSASGIENETTLGTASVGQVHKFSSAGISNDNEIGAGAFNQSGGFTSAGIENENTVGSASVTQIHKFASTGIATDTCIGTGEFSGGGVEQPARRGGMDFYTGQAKYWLNKLEEKPQFKTLRKRVTKKLKKKKAPIEVQEWAAVQLPPILGRALSEQKPKTIAQAMEIADHAMDEVVSQALAEAAAREVRRIKQNNEIAILLLAS